MAREHYAYTKHGSACLLAAIEPLTGKRLVHVQAQRTKREYALFLAALAASYSAAEKIRLVQDNLNPHDASSLYETFPPAEAFALAQRFKFFYPPKAASGLNMIEIEFSALACECLHRRIPSLEALQREVLAPRRRAHRQSHPDHLAVLVDCRPRQVRPSLPTCAGRGTTAIL